MHVLEYDMVVSILIFVLLCYAVRTEGAKRMALWLTRQCAKVPVDALWYGMLLSPFVILAAAMRVSVLFDV